MQSSEIIIKAFEAKESQSKKHHAEHQEKLNKARALFPRLEEIDTELSAIGASLVMSALSGKLEEIEEAKAKSEGLVQEKQALLERAEIPTYTPLCPLCNDTGRIKGEICSCVKEIAKELSLNALKSTTPANECYFDNFSLKYYPEDAQKRMKNILDFSKNYANTFSSLSGNVLFMGKCGLGKTHLSLAVANAVIEKGFYCVYGSAQDLFSAAEKEHFSYSGETEKRDTLIHCDLLIIDDLGTEFNTNFTQSLFYNIVNTRILNKKPTFINTNLSFDELEARYTPRITSRFVGEYTMKQFLGNDIRQLKTLEKLK